MGRNKFSESEIKAIAKLLRLKNAGNRYRQKLVRHDLRVNYEFNISDFNQPGKAFGEEELHEAIRRGAIAILDEQTIADMKAKRARDKERDKARKDAACFQQLQVENCQYFSLSQQRIEIPVGIVAV